MHAHSRTAHRNCVEISVLRLASFDVRVFTDISSECLRHPANPRATTILCVPMTGGDVRRTSRKERRNTDHGKGLNAVGPRIRLGIPTFPLN
ncbi:hypothetical protein AVEN_188595-1 [Araneus ventricosus]|uniref:Uncharacterized protein n=1 Tax=Araneus ventricosus TaxID=182803 RepID=A0A4Y2NTX9_ARAVE|nr:hypothetical protein AVEN_188595-1 [Araneus ventricosus]